MQLTIDWKPGPRVIAADCRVILDNNDRVDFDLLQDRHTVTLARPAKGVIVNPVHDFWPSVVEVAPGAAHVSVTCAPAPNGPLGWWHRALGISATNARRGANTTIGVIDNCLPHDDSAFQHIYFEGFAPALKRAPPAQCGHQHGAWVTSLIAGRTPYSAFEGVAPGAEVHFVCAMEDANDDALSPLAIMEAIEYCAFDLECDLINVSAGDDPDEMEQLRRIVRRAHQRGSLCIFAGGNRPGHVLYPACYPEVTAVGAYGSNRHAPPDSLAHWLKAPPRLLSASQHHFMTGYFSFGPQLNLVAPGIGVVASWNGSKRYPICGTSFASPLATAALAVKLSSDTAYLGKKGSARANHALNALNGLSRPMGLPHPATAVVGLA